MIVSKASSIIGWFFRNTLRIETRETYEYENGNDVTVTTYQDISVSLYDKNGVVIDAANKGKNIDNKT